MYVKGREFLSLAKNGSRNVSKILNGRYRPKLLDGAKKSSPNVLKTVFKRTVFKKQ